MKDINEVGNTNVQFPIIADKDRVVAELYDMIHPNASATTTVRSVFDNHVRYEERELLVYTRCACTNSGL